MGKTALITGVTGQDGSYLAEFLLAKGYLVHGLVRRASTIYRPRIEPLLASHSRSFFLHYGDLTDSSRLSSLLRDIRPDEIYNLAAQSHVRVSFDNPEYTAEVTGMGTIRLLEAIKTAKIPARFYQASSSEMFGGQGSPQSEQTPFFPKSPYGSSKVFAHWSTQNFREAFGFHASSGILFNHESPRRGESFVTRKITRAAARISRGLQDELILGNLQAVRDWGYAPDYVVAMWMMLQQDEPDDYVIATGNGVKVEDFLDFAFKHVGLDWQEFVQFDQKYLRPAEVDVLIGEPQKAKSKLGWTHSVEVEELAGLMVDYDLQILEGDFIDKPRGDLWRTEVNR